MKKLILSAAAALSFFACAFAAETWTSDYAAALETAKKADKPVLVLFTGSDWCPPCMYMEKNVFPSPAFTEFADKNLVLVKLDFPRSKPQSDTVKAANNALAQKFGIEGFPTVVIVSSDGKELARRVGAADPADFLNWLKQAVSAPKKPTPPGA